MLAISFQQSFILSEVAARLFPRPVSWDAAATQSKNLSLFLSHQLAARASFAV
jgi:hypothetical protein